MCGITGKINFDNSLVQEKNIRLMMQKIKHRGPNDEGVFIEENIGLGFVRLSILDLSPAGHQPMHSHNDKYVIIFNGEVYNYIEIREELSSEYNFKTQTDTEVVLAAYQKWGSKCLDRFNGMFAFVIYNKVNKELFGARDRFGIKPFYYYKDQNSLLFSSEIKSILPLITAEANDSIICDFLMYNRTDHTNETFFKNILKIPHGSCFTLKNNELKVKKWYSLKDKLTKTKAITPEQYRELFKESLKLRLRADVPIGVTLSGGIDSSSVVSSLVKDFGINDLNTFSAIFKKNDAIDESKFINEFKSMLCNMHYISPDEKSFMNDMKQFINAHTEPVPDASPYIQFKVMELASKKVTVTIDGQGADEQLAGYHNFFSIYHLELLRKLKFLTFASEITNYFKKHKNPIVLGYLVFYMLPIFFQNKFGKNFFPSIKKDFIKNNSGKNNVLKNLYKPKNLNHSLIQHFENKLEHLLKWEDLNSMHFSIESRVPFLDHRLVEATLNTPSNQKIYKGETKHILREAMKDILPEKITLRKDKKGFESPQAKWYRTQNYQKYIYNIINSNIFKNRGYFNADIAAKQFENHLSKKSDNSVEIWKWINLELWFREYIDNK